MSNPPKELIKQIKLIADAIDNINDLVDNKKIKIENYGKDFLDPLNKIRTKAMELRNDLEVFKHNMERAITEQYYKNNRFASKEVTKNIIDKFLSSNNDF